MDRNTASFSSSWMANKLAVYNFQKELNVQSPSLLRPTGGQYGKGR